MSYYPNIVDTIGRTPLIKLNRIAGKLIVTVGCSTGERYLPTALADEARNKTAL